MRWNKKHPKSGTIRIGFALLPVSVTSFVEGRYVTTWFWLETVYYMYSNNDGWVPIHKAEKK